MAQLTKDEIEAALLELGAVLADRGKHAQIVVYGGAALLLQFDIAFRTADVDVVIETGHSDALAAIHEIARRRGWPPSWMNENVSAYVSAHPQRNFYRDYPDPIRRGLTVMVASPTYMLAMKLAALRAGSRDRDDAIALARETGLTRFDELRDLYEATFAQTADPQRLVLIQDIVDAVAAP